MLATCRIYLFTYKRNSLLPRAIKSIQNQTFTNWVCEVHNDDPTDGFPAHFIECLQDSRFIIKNHTQNLGATTCFNIAFAGSDEKYGSILEDDNWWEPQFLEEMISILDTNLNVDICWSNMNLWVEKGHNQWENTLKTIWPTDKNNTLFEWFDLRQAMGALHSNGSMLYRNENAKELQIPNECDFSIMEAVRERTFKFPIYLHHKTLANFAHTLNTSRSNNKSVWTGGQILLLSSFLLNQQNVLHSFKKSLQFYRKQKPSPVINFFLANLFLIKNDKLFRLFNLQDWLKIAKWMLLNLTELNKINQYVKENMVTYQFLKDKTNKRTKELKN
ncbi:MAG: glycosyltransferase [Pedobacter sp.]|nr:MAG: glycosyltransferase [Pedobacter sp.]